MFGLFESTKNIGLALGGGATKGFMHIGVYRYLEQYGYQIQEIAGTSMGSLIGSLIALGWSSYQIEEYFTELNNTDILDVDWAQISIKGQKIIEKMQDIFGDKHFEDLEVPFYVVATNLDTGKERVFNSGPIIDALRVSISIPGVFSVYDKQTGLVDGGVVNNLPVNHLSSSQIIASSCLGFGVFDRKKENSLRGFAIPESGISFKVRLLIRSLHVMMRRIEDVTIAESAKDIILIRPDLSDISMIDLSVVSEAVQRGYARADDILS